MTDEFFEDAWGNVSKTRCKCVGCTGSDYSSKSRFGNGVGPWGETCFVCGGFGWVCEPEEKEKE